MLIPVVDPPDIDAFHLALRTGWSDREAGVNLARIREFLAGHDGPTSNPSVLKGATCLAPFVALISEPSLAKP